ncbi:DegV family protein [Pseudothermotoga thermarum]|uniref:DegV family protein n=1 Tax=Pseudothermotoga thermarum DSM 5069 TaxID=688269 RepID=F7YTP5_9THEM|nr:DegV family protein [Pseudothermotoga thermarum]AEH51267.1 degV family protein [Pseudothermotoga thermarum DSM 5069]
MNCAIVVDSTIDIPEDYVCPIPLYILPLRIFIDNKEYKDRVDISCEEIYEELEKGKKITTSLPSPSDALSLLQKLSKQFEQIVVLTVSSKLSGTFNMIKMLVEQMSLKKVNVFDTKAVSGKIFHIVQRVAADLLKGEKITQEKILEYNKSSLMLFVLNSLEYLKKGGRIGKLSAFMGKLFNLKPILSIDEEGEVYKVTTAKSEEQMIDKIVELVERFAPDRRTVYAGYGKKTMERLVFKLQEKLGKIAGLARIGPAVAAHAGPETFGVLVVKE